jgi:peptidoglycan/LPS O-acetylase OafA/YrhL
MNNRSKVQKISQRNDIQVYRGISVIAVLLYHFDPNIFNYGYLGVDVFFLISGFVISNLVFSKLDNNQFSIKGFYFQRFRRIFPSLISFILFVQLLIYFFLDHEFIIQTTKGNIYSIFFLSNVYFSQVLDYFNISASKNFIINLWSLSVEEQFYIIFPIVAIIISKFSNLKKILIFLVFLLISLAFYLNQLYAEISIFKKLFFTFENFIFYSPFTRASQFLFGVLAMFIHQSKRKKIFSVDNLSYFTIFQLLVLVFMTYKFDFGSKNIKTAIVLSIFFFLLSNEIKFGQRKNLLFTFFFFTGNISYSLYLFHQPLLASVRNYNVYSEEPFNIDLQITNFFNVLVIFLIIYIVSYVNFLLIENRYRFAKEFQFRNFKNVFYIFSMAIFLIILSLNSNGYEFRDKNIKTFNSESKLSFVSGTNYIAENNIQCINRDSINQACTFNESDKKIYIIGDSVMSSIVSGFVDNKDLDTYKIIEFTRGGCPLLINYCEFFEGSGKYKELSSITNSIIIFGGQYLPYENNTDFGESLLETVKLFVKDNKVFFYGTFPSPGVNVRMYKQINKIYPETNQTFADNEKTKVEILLQLEDIENLHVINPRDIFCSSKLCKYYSDSHYFYIDHIHFGYYGAKKIGNHFVNNFLDTS